MGLSYSLCALFDRRDSASFLPGFAELLDPPSRARIAELVWSPAVQTNRLTLIGTTETDARGIAGIDLGGGETDNSYCFSFHIQLEPEMRDHLEGLGLECFDSPGSFGCMWTSVLAGAKYLFVEVSAATSGMSRVLRDSERIQQSWREFARATNAIVGYVDLEDDGPRQLHPGAGELILPDRDTLSFAGDYYCSIDLMAEYVRRSNGV